MCLGGNPLDMRLTAEHGWRRFLGHFFIFAAIPNIVAAIAQEFGWSVLWFAIATYALFILAVLLTTAWEVLDVLENEQTWGKAVIDMVSKVGGLGVGFALWLQWWWQ